MVLVYEKYHSFLKSLKIHKRNMLYEMTNDTCVKRVTNFDNCHIIFNMQYKRNLKNCAF